MFQVDNLKFSAFGDRVLIEEDEFKSGYECDFCAGAGKVKCSNCNGDGHYSYAGSENVMTCKTCGGNGIVRCETCGGKGGLLAVPEESQRRPTTGTIVSVGAGVKDLVPGQAVLYSSYAGHTIDLARAGKKVVMRILHEPEVLCLVEGHLTLRIVRDKSEIAGTM